MQDRQHGAATRRIEELRRVPARRERAGFRFAVTHDAGDDRVGAVERDPEGMRQTIAELAAFVQGSRHHRAEVAWEASRPGELVHQLREPLTIAAQLRVVLRERSLEEEISENSRSAVSGADDQRHVGIDVADQAVQMRIDEVEPGLRAPVSEQSWFDMLRTKRLA